MGLLAGAFAITFGIPAIAIIGIGAGVVIGVLFGLEITDRHFGVTDKAKNYSDQLGL